MKSRQSWRGEVLSQTVMGFVDEGQSVPGELFDEAIDKVVEFSGQRPGLIVTGAVEQRNYLMGEAIMGLSSSEVAAKTVFGSRNWKEATIVCAPLKKNKRCTYEPHNAFCRAAGNDTLPKDSFGFVALPDFYNVVHVTGEEGMPALCENVMLDKIFDMQWYRRVLNPENIYMHGSTAIFTIEAARAVKKMSEGVVLSKLHKAVDKINSVFCERVCSSPVVFESGTSIRGIGSEGDHAGDVVSSAFADRSFSGLQPGRISVFAGLVLQLLVQWGEIRKREMVVAVAFPGCFGDGNGLAVVALKDLISELDIAEAQGIEKVSIGTTHRIFRVNMEATVANALALRRYQFPITSAICTTYDNCISQEWKRVSVDCRRTFDSHGQLNVVASRTRSVDNLFWFVPQIRKNAGWVKNVVNEELLKLVERMKKI